MDHMYIIALVILGVILVIGVCLKPQAPNVEVVNEEKPPEKVKTEIGTFRIVPCDFKIYVERYLQISSYYDGPYRGWVSVDRGWVSVDKDGLRHDSRYSRTLVATFDTEEEAEVFIAQVLEKEAVVKREAEEKKRVVAEFAAAHPIREIPPFKFGRKT